MNALVYKITQQKRALRYLFYINYSDTWRARAVVKLWGTRVLEENIPNLVFVFNDDYVVRSRKME